MRKQLITITDGQRSSKHLTLAPLVLLDEWRDDEVMSPSNGVVIFLASNLPTSVKPMNRYPSRPGKRIGCGKTHSSHEELTTMLACWDCHISVAKSHRQNTWVAPQLWLLDCYICASYFHSFLSLLWGFSDLIHCIGYFDELAEFKSRSQTPRNDWRQYVSSTAVTRRWPAAINFGRVLLACKDSWPLYIGILTFWSRWKG